MASLQPAYETPNTGAEFTRRAGVAMPATADQNGRLSTVTGERNDFKTIALALMGSDSDNPWEQRADDIDQAMFDLDGPQGRAVIQRRLENAFASFETQHRYRLIPNTVEFRRENGVTLVYFKYHNLESDQTRDLAVPVGGV